MESGGHPRPFIRQPQAEDNVTSPIGIFGDMRGGPPGLGEPELGPEQRHPCKLGTHASGDR